MRERDLVFAINRIGLLVALGILVTLTACTSTASADSIAVTATDRECRVGRSDLKAGNNTFAVHNDGSEVTEVYVYASGDKVVSEKENIGPGTEVTFTADLVAGQYEIACKPGQKGDGVRQRVTVSGGGGAAAKPADREVRLTAQDYSYAGLDNLAVRAGETIEFDMDNRGTMDHEFEVSGPDGKVVGEIGPTKAGTEGKVTLTFDRPGTYRFVCGIADHEARGMVGTFTVS